MTPGEEQRRESRGVAELEWLLCYGMGGGEAPRREGRVGKQPCGMVRQQSLVRVCSRGPRVAVFRLRPQSCGGACQRLGSWVPQEIKSGTGKAAASNPIPAQPISGRPLSPREGRDTVLAPLRYLLSLAVI